MQNNFEAKPCNTTLVGRFTDGPYDGDEILMQAGEYSVAPPQLIAQPFIHQQHGPVYACYELENGFEGWPNEEFKDRVIAYFNFKGYRSAVCDVEDID